MAPKKSTKKSGPQRKPSAQKRVITSQKRALINQCFKSKAKTMIKKFETALKSGDQENISLCLQAVYSVADKAVKRGIFKENKAARVKARACAKVQAALA